jgi:hypothetical protein
MKALSLAVLALTTSILLVFPLTLVFSQEKSVDKVQFAEFENRLTELTPENFGQFMADYKLSGFSSKDIEEIKTNPFVRAQLALQFLAPQKGSVAGLLPNTYLCDDYQYGSVQIPFEPTVLSTVPGVPLTFVGNIQNNNKYPLVRGQIYLKIFRKGNDKESVQRNGHDLVYQGVVMEDLFLDANQEKPINFTWRVPNNTAEGEYQAAVFFQSSKKFNFLGLSFTDDIVGNTADFSITSEEKQQAVFLDKDSVTLNKTPYHFAAFPPHFGKDDVVIAEADLLNKTSNLKNVSITWTLYNWDALQEKNLIETRTEQIELKANERRRMSYTAEKSTGAVSYLVVEAQEGESKSILDVRFVRDEISEARINFSGIIRYPLKAGESNALFSCLHSTNMPLVKDGELELSLKDFEGNTIHTYTYKGDVSGSMMEIKDEFVTDKDYSDFLASVSLKKSGEIVETVTQEYRCEDINPRLCPPEEIPQADSKILTITLLVVLLTSIFGTLFILRRRHTYELS